MFVRAVFLTLLATICSGDCIFIETRRGAVQVEAFDVQGPVPSISVELIEQKSARKGTGARPQLDEVLYGVYNLRVTAPGYDASEVRIRLDQPILHVRAQLAPDIRECPSFPSISGRVVGVNGETTLWVKVVPVYGGGGIDAPVNAGGYFLASGLDLGPYLVVLMDGQKPIHFETVRLLSDVRLTITR